MGSCCVLRVLGPAKVLGGIAGGDRKRIKSLEPEACLWIIFPIKRELAQPCSRVVLSDQCTSQLGVYQTVLAPITGVSGMCSPNLTHHDL